MDNIQCPILGYTSDDLLGDSGLNLISSHCDCSSLLPGSSEIQIKKTDKLSMLSSPFPFGGISNTTALQQALRNICLRGQHALRDGCRELHAIRRGRLRRCGLHSGFAPSPIYMQSHRPVRLYPRRSSCLTLGVRLMFRNRRMTAREDDHHESST